MTDVHQKPAIAGFFGTIFIWILISLFFYFSAILFAPKQYKAIKIRLDSPAKIENGKMKNENREVENGKLKTENLERSELAQKTDLPKVSEVAQESNQTPKGEVDSGTAFVENRRSETEKSFSQILPASPSLPTPSLQPPTASSATSSTGDGSGTAFTETRRSETEKPFSQVLPLTGRSLPRNAPSPQKAESGKMKNENEAKTPPQAQKTKTKQTVQPKHGEQVLQKSMEEFLEEQQAKKTQKKEFDWSQFDEIEGNSSSNSKSTAVAKNKPVPQNALSGSAASTSTGSNTSASSSSQSARTASGQMASSATTSALANAVSAKKYSSIGGEISAKTGNSASGKVLLATSDGKTRELVTPSYPALDLSEEAQNLAVNYPAGPYAINFTIRPNGTVDFSTIKIPETLPLLIQSELKNQLKDWQFSPTDYFGTVEFKYTMKRN